MEGRGTVDSGLDCSLHDAIDRNLLVGRRVCTHFGSITEVLRQYRYGGGWPGAVGEAEKEHVRVTTYMYQAQEPHNKAQATGTGECR